MEAMTVVDIDSFTDFVIKKKYQLYKNGDKNISFKYITSKEDVFLIERTEKNDAVYIKYMINNSDEYQNIKQQLNQANYVFDKSENSENGVHLHYKRLDNKFIASVMIMKEFYKIYIFPL